MTEDQKDREIFEPRNLILGEKLLLNFMDFNEPEITFDAIIDKICKIKRENLKEKNVR